MPLNKEFYARVDEALSEEDKLFADLSVNLDCQCPGMSVYCVCTLKEMICRKLAKIAHLETTEAKQSHFNKEQRENILDDTVYCSEGSVSREECEKMTDAELFSQWLQSVSDYAQSQF